MLETENYSYEEWYLIFLHELTHQKKHDLWYKMFLQIIRDVYWFCIPMLWVQKMANIDMECVCDATVTKYMNLTQRKDYCNVILKVASKQTRKELSGVVSMVSETKILKERFYNVFLARKKLRIYITVFLFGIIILSFSGNANSAANMVIIVYRKLSQMQSCGTRRSGLGWMGK